MLDTFIERVKEVLGGEASMNCSLCKYRAQVLGFEQEVGLDQASHHHHVEGLTEACDLCEKECTGACQPDGIPIPLGGAHHHHHNHDHGHHHPYPHADHPLGPSTLRRAPSKEDTPEAES